MDINALRERLASLNRRTQKGNDIWKPKDEHDIRLLRPSEKDDPLVALHFHYEIGDVQSVLCPKMNFGDDCAICDLCDQLKSWKTPDGEEKAEHDRKADWEIFKKIQPKARVLVAMVERGKEAEGAKWWNITSGQAEALLKECTDGDCLAELGISPDDGEGALNVLFGKKAYDLHVSFAKPGEKGNTKQFGQVSFKTKKKPSSLAADAKAEQALLTSIKKITEVYPKVPSAEVAKILAKFVGQGSKEATTDGGTEYKSNKSAAAPAAATNSSENAKVSGTKSIDEAFSDLVDD